MDIDVAIIGVGVVGAAVARAVSREQMSCMVLERGPRVAEGITSRNSGVVHAGIYYPPGSLKAESCIRGAALLYEWCESQGVPHRRNGKWIVGLDDDAESLEWLHCNALACGAQGLRRVGRAEIRGALPGCPSTQGLFSTRSGSVDPYELTRSLMQAAEGLGAQFVMNGDVTAIEALAGGGYELLTSRGPIRAGAVINCAGLASDQIAALVGIRKYRIYPWRGDYFALRDARSFRAHVYPVKSKNDPGLGVHLTVGSDGTYRLGPDAYAVDSCEYFAEPRDVEAKKAAFAAAASRYLGPVSPDQLRYDSCGIRPKLRAPDDTEERDFVLSEDLPRFINLIGIESPGLTASLDLADRAAALVKRTS